MAASGRLSISQDGGQSNVRLHPYLVALVRWCISSFWTTATVILHRLITAPLPPASAPKPKPRPASNDHLHPEPLVVCEVLYKPPSPTVDVIFIHGLYGSLANTWRQGEWRFNYSTDPVRVPLRRPNALPTACGCKWERDEDAEEDCVCDCRIKNEAPSAEENEVMTDLKQVEFADDKQKLLDEICKVIPEDDIFVTEKFYNNTLLDQVEIVGNFETQANFVRDLFEKENCDIDRDVDDEEFVESKNKSEVICKCTGDVKCEVGCGCICDHCYSPCWPRDWIKVDFPGARVISINYTSDPYLWRPLWIKECKRQRLHDRAEQMMEQLLELGVGDRPIVWVGHSKGGLFIKQMYCEAYEAYIKLNEEDANKEEEPDTANVLLEENREDINEDEYIENKYRDSENNIILEANKTNHMYLSNLVNSFYGIQNDIQKDVYDSNSNTDCLKTIRIDDGKDVNDDANEDSDTRKERSQGNTICPTDSNGNLEATVRTSSYNEEDPKQTRKRASLWRNSVGFMFYSVPHRGSPLADIKTPITARSIELLEICKDCSLVVSLHERWLRATSSSKPAVSSLVETCKTLMSLLWLRIVSVDSADPGIGTLSGVSVDHREICKPSSRKCLLYRELKMLIHNALNSRRHKYTRGTK